MKQIIENKYLKVFRFSSSKEALTFLGNQKIKNNMLIEDSFGENYYCYICYHSLTQEQLFSLSFYSDEKEDDLNFLFWDDILVLDTGRNIYLIDEYLRIKILFEITTPLIGLYLVNKERLLLLEESYLRVINNKGKIVKDKMFDLIENFSIENGSLSIQTSERSEIIKLT